MGIFDVEAWERNEWIESILVEEYFNMTFSECIKKFGHCRTASWLPDPFNGQKITNYFRRYK